MFGQHSSFLLFCVIGFAGALIGNVGCNRQTPSTQSQIDMMEDRVSDSDLNTTTPVSPAKDGEDAASEIGLEQTDVAPPEPARLYAEALGALNAGEDDTAFEITRQALHLAPDDPQITFLMAIILGNRNRFPEAIRMLDDLSQSFPETRLPAMGQTADWLVRYGQWSEAEDRYRRLLDELPDAPLVHRNLARLLLREGRRTEASSHLYQLCRVGDVTELELRSLLSIVCPLAADAERQEYDSIGPLGTARAEIARGQWDTARRQLEQLDPIGPNESALLGRVYASLNDIDATEQWLRSYEDPAEGNADAWFAKGVHAASKGNHKLAIDCFVNSVLIDQTDYRAYQMLSRSLEEDGEIDRSKTAALRAKLIQQTQELGAEMAESENREVAKLSELIDLLDRLKRPLEALAWRGIQLAYAQAASSLSGAEAQQVMEAIVLQRAAILESGSSTASRSFITCDIDPSRSP